MDKVDVLTWQWCIERSLWSGLEKRGLLEKGSFQKSPFSRDSREFRYSRDLRESPDSGKQRSIRPFSRDSRESRDFRDSRDSSSEKTPFVMTPFSGPDLGLWITLEALKGDILKGTSENEISHWKSHSTRAPPNHGCVL